MYSLILLFLFLCFFTYGSNCYSYQDTFVNDNLSTEIRGQIFSPDRQNIHLVNVDVPTAIKEIQKVFDREPRDIKSIECYSYPFAEDVNGELILTTLCPGKDPSVHLMNLWSSMTNGFGPLPHPDSVCNQLKEAGYINVTFEQLIPSLFLFRARKSV